MPPLCKQYSSSYQREGTVEVEQDAQQSKARPGAAGAAAEKTKPLDRRGPRVVDVSTVAELPHFRHLRSRCRELPRLLCDLSMTLFSESLFPGWCSLAFFNMESYTSLLVKTAT